MKKAIIMTMTAIAIAACAKKESSAENQQKGQVATPVEKAAGTTNSEAEVVYTCPMHPEVVGKKGDKCPKCEMDLVAKE